MSSLLDLPNNLFIYEILPYLSYPDLISFSQINSRVRDLVKTESIWLEKLKTDFPGFAKQDNQTYYQIYNQLYHRPKIPVYFNGDVVTRVTIYRKDLNYTDILNGIEGYSILYLNQRCDILAALNPPSYKAGKIPDLDQIKIVCITNCYSSGLSALASDENIIPIYLINGKIVDLRDGVGPILPYGLDYRSIDFDRLQNIYFFIVSKNNSPSLLDQSKDSYWYNTIEFLESINHEFISY